MPFDSIRAALRRIRHDEPGNRFEAAHERLRIRNGPLRIGAIALGIGLIVAAAVTFFLPGPNFVLVLAGLALVAGQWRAVAVLLDRGEVAGRRSKAARWDPMSSRRKHAAIAVVWLIFAAAVGLVALAAWRLGLLPGWLPIVG